VDPLKNVFLGPSFITEECIDACNSHRDKPEWQILEDPHDKAAELLADGQLVAWFQGAMEFGPRALGNRSILANPAQPGVADLLNRQVKFREHWRPFSPSILDSVAAEILPANCQDEYMCLSVQVDLKWQEQYPVLFARDGTTRPQVVTQQSNPEFHKLLGCFQERTGHGVLINTTLSRPGEALICSPEDAVSMFLGTDLNYLIMENLLVTKRPESDTW
jgi:carbamoyltransferase